MQIFQGNYDHYSYVLNRFPQPITAQYFRVVVQTWDQWRIQKISVGGDFKHISSKIRMSSPELRVIFRPKSVIQTFFSPKIRWSPTKKKKKRSSPNLRVIFQPKSENLTFFSPKIGWSPKKKRSSPESLGCGWWGGDASRNGAKLFEIEADFSAKIVTFRLVGGMHPPP